MSSLPDGNPSSSASCDRPILSAPECLVFRTQTQQIIRSYEGCAKLILVIPEPKKLKKGGRMTELPMPLIIGSIMILLGTAVAVWIAISIVRQNRKDQSFPE
jgi:hypothetical protein